MKKLLVLSAALLSVLSAPRAYADPEPEGYSVDQASIVIYVVTGPPFDQSSDGVSYALAQGVGSAGQVNVNAAAKFSPMRFSSIKSSPTGSAYVDQHLSQTYVHTGTPGTYTVSFIHAIAQGQAHSAVGGNASVGAYVSGQANGAARSATGYFESYDGENGGGDGTGGFNAGDVYEVAGPYSPIVYTQVESYLWASASTGGSGLNNAMAQAITEVYPYAHYGTPPEGIGGEGGEGGEGP